MQAQLLRSRSGGSQGDFVYALTTRAARFVIVHTFGGRGSPS